ncbi:MAG TPA: hypothetical protein PLM07_17805 [Candidatus Rifleibacterium sp.]|nr:hypothetical protein [Candidatus Rifleibacterium sp.]HPT47737.1 hypothetical protein [Candidatus Rifleibacterium sp.]
MNKKALLLAAALASSPTINAQTIPSPEPEPAKDENCVASATNDRALARQKLIDALKSMKNNPEEIEFHSAMCYKMALPPNTFDYSCPGCGAVTTHQYYSAAGKMSRQIASVRRSLPNLPVEISVNETSLCQHCSKGSEPALVFTSKCGKCQAIFSWKTADDKDLKKLDWLFLDYQSKSINLGPGKGSKKDPEQVKEMVRFVAGCTFCPACVKDLQLDYPE